MNEILSARFQIAQSVRDYNKAKRQAAELTQREQLELVDQMIAARFRIEGGAR